MEVVSAINRDGNYYSSDSVCIFTNMVEYSKEKKTKSEKKVKNEREPRLDSRGSNKILTGIENI